MENVVVYSNKDHELLDFYSPIDELASCDLCNTYFQICYEQDMLDHISEFHGIILE